MANGFVPHCGLADRIKGILSVYSWCKSRNVEFKIHFVSPFRLEKYLLPNEYDWMIDDDEVSYDRSTKVSYFMLDFVSRTMSKSYINKQLIKWMDCEWLDYKGQAHVYTNINCCQGEYNRLFTSLFKTSEELSSLLLRTINEIGGDYITISFRFMSLLGDFRDVVDLKLPIEEQNLLIARCLDAISHIRTMHSIAYKIVITSDSERFLHRAKVLPGILVLPGKIGHIEYETNSAVHTKAFLDFFIISQAKKVYLVKTDQMYNSDFARTAAFIGNRPFELIVI